MGRNAIQRAQCCAVILIALMLLAGCASRTQAAHQQTAPTPTPTPSAQPTPSGAASSCDSDAKQAGKAPPLISLSQYGFHPGQSIGFQGNGFQPGEDVNILLGTAQSTPQSQKNQSLASTTANNGGNLQGTVFIALMSPGNYHLYFMGQQCTVTVGIILLQFKPWVTLDNYAPFPNYRMGFHGEGFAPNEPVQVYLNTQDSQPIAALRADSSGQFAQNQVWNVGDLNGQNTLLFQGMDTKLVVSVNFIVQNPTTGQITASLSHAATAPYAALPAERAAARAGSGPAASRPAAVSSLTIDPFTVALGLLVLWFILSFVLVLATMFDHLPTWPRLRWPSKRAGTLIPAPARVTAITPMHWPRLNQRGLPTPGMQVSSQTERGLACIDQEDEDNFLAITGIRREQGQPHPFALLVVADSVGHYADGQSAGRKTIHTVFQSLVPYLIQEDAPHDDLCAQLESTLQGANRLLYWQNQRESADSSCSITAALISRQMAFICSIGNSRTYMLPAGAPLRRVTTDHSIVERWVAAGITPLDDVPSSPRHSRLYRSLGQHPDAQIDTFRLPVAVDDQLLLCSNGLWESLSDADLETMLRQRADAAPASSRLIEHARARGSSADNVTAIIIRFAEIAACSNQPGIDTIASGSSHLTRQRIS